MLNRQFTLNELPEVVGEIINQLEPGDILALIGDLAAGKTTLAQELLRQFGYVDRVTSPTFVLEKHYPVAFNNFNEVIHLDFYRLGEKDLKSFGWQDYLGLPGTLTIIEWPERVGKFLPEKIKKISLEIIDGKTRNLKTENFTTKP